ncbi:MAG: hypothetical protein LBH96_06515 [Candidatus Peribacteria bacterium]|nr:hypothetical protein [Candidatus Peribacteria bacterium]
MKKVLLWTLSILVLLALAVVVRNYLPSQPVVEAPAQQEEIQPLDELPVDELSEVITGEGVNTELPDITEFVRTETVNCEL